MFFTIFNDKHNSFEIDTASFPKYLTVKIEVPRISGGHAFCFPLGYDKIILEQLDVMNKSLKGAMIVQDYDSESFIELKFVEQNRLLINGKFGYYDTSNSFTFLFEVDQTVIGLLFNQLSGMGRGVM